MYTQDQWKMEQIKGLPGHRRPVSVTVSVNAKRGTKQLFFSDDFGVGLGPMGVSHLPVTPGGGQKVFDVAFACLNWILVVADREKCICELPAKKTHRQWRQRYEPPPSSWEITKVQLSETAPRMRKSPKIVRRGPGKENNSVFGDLTTHAPSSVENSRVAFSVFPNVPKPASGTSSHSEPNKSPPGWALTPGGADLARHRFTCPPHPSFQSRG